VENNGLISLLKEKYGLVPLSIDEPNADETYLACAPAKFGAFCMALHKELSSPVMAMFAREIDKGFRIYCAFLSKGRKKWFFATLDVKKEDPQFDSIAKEIYSANLFEREMKEMFGIEPKGNPDRRRLHLHDEVWPRGYYPLRKDFIPPADTGKLGEYEFVKVEGEGIYEVPVGPVHAGIIGPGHFRFSVAGEPIINLEIRLGFTHRGVEKLMEGKSPLEALKISECVAGDSSAAHALVFCLAIEKITKAKVPLKAQFIRAVFLELERMYSHAGDIGGIALDVGFSQAAALASIIKESIHQLNDKLSGSRFLRGAIVPGGISKDISGGKKLIIDSLLSVMKDFRDLKKTLNSSISFLDRVDTTGMLTKKTADDFGVLGVIGRASGIDTDLRRDVSSIYEKLDFKSVVSQSGDVLGRLNVRFDEFEASVNIIQKCLDMMPPYESVAMNIPYCEGYALGCAEGWRGPVLYWLSIDKSGKIERCKIVDPSFRSWPGLSYAVLENIIPDFPVCNKSFDLSYAGGDL